MKKTLYLMRHGQTLFNTLNRIQGWCDSPLTEKGRDQARQVRAYFEKHDIHLHIPEGAVPKDGPSAGITMALAILSAITGIPVRGDIAMTGEITLRGKVLPIGGLKEKLLAAKTVGVKEVLVPARNKRNVVELDEEITDGMKITYVEDMNEVIEHAMKK